MRDQQRLDAIAKAVAAQNYRRHRENEEDRRAEAEAEEFQAPRLTDRQKAMFESLGLEDFQNLALVSTIEKATGKHRALVMSVAQEGDVVEMRPVAMLLDDDDDIDLFEPPAEGME